MQFNGFPRDTLPYLHDLSLNNDREWFNEHKARYEASVRGPALAFIEAMAPRLAESAPELRALAKKVGGSLMRIQRDTRFSNNKSPYKTNIGIQFRHRAGKDVHAPGLYLHVANDGCFLGAGIWRPESKALAAIRTAIDENPRAYQKAIGKPPFSDHYELSGESLIRPPRGFTKDHPLIDELKRKDFIGITELPLEALHSAELPDFAMERFKAAHGLMSFLCFALDQPY